MIHFIKNWLNRYFSDPQLIILVLLLGLGFVLTLTLGRMLTPVFAGLVIAYLLDGMVARLWTAGMPRNGAVIIVFMIFMACVLLLIIWLLPLLSEQIGQLLHDLPSMASKGQKEFMRLPERYPEFISETQVTKIMDFFSTEVSRIVQRLLSISVASVRGIISVVVYLILVPLLAFFFLKDKELIIGWFKQFLPEESGLATAVWHEVNQQISNYVRGKIWEIIILWAASYLVFTLLDLQFALLVSFFIGLSVIVPYIGATVMFFPVVIIAYFQWGFTHQLTYAAIAYAVLQLLDGNLLAPLLLSEVVNIHPVAIIVAVLFFGGMWGLWGLFFAIPLATLVHAVIKAWYGTLQRAREKVEDTASG